MATQPVHERFVSVEEYLSTVYEHDCEYDNGVVVERPLGEFEHSFLQLFIGTLFINNRSDWGVLALSEQRVQIGPTKFLVPDICVLRAGTPREKILTHPPLIVIEILSPEDTMRRVRTKAAQYLDFGVEHVWVIDPYEREAYRGTKAGLMLISSGEFTVPGTPIVIHLAGLFDELDKA